MAPVDPKEYRKFIALNVVVLLVAIGINALFSEGTFFSGMRIYMGLAWGVYAAFQLAGYNTFVHAFRGYDILAARFKWYAYAYPFIELAWSVMYFADLAPVFRDLSVLVLMSIGLIGIYRSIRMEKHMVNCACLGSIIKLPLSKIALYEDGLMAVMAAAMLARTLL